MTLTRGIPKNVAIIMDGNGRWAKARGLTRTEGHKEGVNSVDAIITAAREYKLQSLVLYAFSTENWQRPKSEIMVLMSYLSEYLDRELERLLKNNIRFDAIGRLHDLPTHIIEKIERNRRQTRTNTGLRLVVALSYGGRQEIIDAVRGIARDVRDGSLQAEEIDEERFRRYVYLPDLPDPDLLIRTSGEMRISNFLLWQISYAELYVTDTLWPDFRKEEFAVALNTYTKRERRFGQ